MARSIIRISQRRWRNVSILLGACLGAVLVREYFTPLLGDDDAVVSGWLLFAIVILLMIWNARKKFPNLNLLKASIWLQIHVYTGVFAMVVFVIHIGYEFPRGGFDLTLGSLFALTCLSGLIGLALSRSVPGFLSDDHGTGIFDKIPSAMHDLKTRVNDALLRHLETSDSDSQPLIDLYQRHLHPFMSGHRDVLLHLVGSRRAGFDLLRRVNLVSQNATSKEQRLLTEIRECINSKIELDRQYTWQAILKYWLFLHIPVAFMLTLAIVAHIALVHAFRGHY